MLAAVICERMKWTYEQLQEAPTRFVSAIIEMLKAEAYERAKQNKKNQ